MGAIVRHRCGGYHGHGASRAVTILWRRDAQVFYFDRLEPEAKVRAVGLLRSFLPVVPKIILFCRGEILDAIPESFDWIVELGVLGSKNPRPRVRKSGVGKVKIN